MLPSPHFALNTQTRQMKRDELTITKNGVLVRSASPWWFYLSTLLYCCRTFFISVVIVGLLRSTARKINIGQGRAERSNCAWGEYANMRRSISVFPGVTAHILSFGPNCPPDILGENIGRILYVTESHNSEYDRLQDGHGPIPGMIRTFCPGGQFFLEFPVSP